MKPLLLTAIFLSSVATPTFAVRDDFMETERIHTLDMQKIDAIVEQTMRVDVFVLDDSAEGGRPYSWQMNPTDWPVLFSRIKKSDERAAKFDDLKIKQPSDTYKGLEIRTTNRFSEQMEAFTIFNGYVVDPKGVEYTSDADREIEYWLWGTAPEHAARAMSQERLPVISFKQCVSLGNRIIYTAPRQCLMTNGDILLDVLEEPTQESVNIKNFDDCLEYGQALINTFPRRCIAAGGHVYTEPPRLD